MLVIKYLNISENWQSIFLREVNVLLMLSHKDWQSWLIKPQVLNERFQVRCVLKSFKNTFHV